MPTKREREYYAMGFRDGLKAPYTEDYQVALGEADSPLEVQRARRSFERYSKPKRKRKLSAWNKYVKNKRNHITYRDGKLNLKKMAVAFRRKKRR